MEQSSRRYCRFEHHRVQKHFATEGAHNPNGGYLANLLINIKVRRAAQIDASIREIDRSLGVVCEASKKFFACSNHLVRLTAELCNFARQAHVLVGPVHTAERIARQRA